MFLFDLLRRLWRAIMPVSVPPPEPVIPEPDPVVVVVPPDPPPPPPVTLPLLSTQPTSRWFHTPDGHPLDYREATAMGIYRLWLDGEHERIDYLFYYFRSRGINAIRVVLSLDSEWWHTQGCQNSHLEGDKFWSGLVPFLQCAEGHGLYVRLCLFGGVEPFGGEPDWNARPDVVSEHSFIIDAMHNFTDQVVETTCGQTNVLYEVANEPAQIGFGDDSSVILLLGQHIKDLAPLHLMNFGAATDEESIFYANFPSDFLDEHFARHDEWDMHASIKRLISHPATDQQVMPVISGEWMNLGLHGTESTATALATTAMLRLKKVIPAFHARCLLFGNIPGTITDDSLKAWSLGLDTIPMDFEGMECNGHWDCSPFDPDIFPPTEEATDEWDGPVRIFGLDGPTGYMGLSIREPHGYDLQSRSERPIETVHLERWGDWQSRIIIAGS